MEVVIAVKSEAYQDIINYVISSLKEHETDKKIYYRYNYPLFQKWNKKLYGRLFCIVKL